MEKKNLLAIIVVQIYEIMKIQMHFQSNYLKLKNIYTHVYILEFFFKMEFFFHLKKNG
jgi:hypothetical protein